MAKYLVSLYGPGETNGAVPVGWPKEAIAVADDYVKPVEDTRTLMTQAELDAVEAALQADFDSINNSRLLTRAKTEKVTALSMQFNGFILQRYAQHRQASLTMLYQKALADGQANRAAYIKQAIDWIEGVLDIYYTVRDQVVALADISSVESFTYDFSALEATDPMITLEQAVSIKD